MIKASVPKFTERIIQVWTILIRYFNLLSANFTNWSNTLKQFVGNFPTNCLNVFHYFVKLALKGLIIIFRLTLFTLFREGWVFIELFAAIDSFQFIFYVKQKNTLIVKYLTLLCLCFLLLCIYHNNLFLANVPILYPLKTPEKRFSGVLEGIEWKHWPTLD